MVLSPRLRVPSNWSGASIHRMAVALISEPKSEWPALTSDMEGTNPLTMTEWLIPYIWPWKEPILSPCQNGYGNHHFSLEEISIWRTPSFFLKYSNFTLAIGFVNTLAICSFVPTYWSFTAPLCTISQIKSLERIWGKKWASKWPKCTIKIN